MLVYKLLFVIFLMANQKCGMARDLELPANCSLVDLSAENITRADILLSRDRRRAAVVKKTFTIFAKRLWKGLRMYIQGNSLVRKRHGPGNIQRLLNLSMPVYKQSIFNVVPVDFVPVYENVQWTPNSTVFAVSKNWDLSRITLNQTHAQLNIYHYMRQKWKNQLVSDNYDETQPAIGNYVQSLSETAINLYHTLNRKPDRWYLWKMKLGDSPASDYTTQFLNLYKLTLAYGTNGTAYYRNETILTTVINGIDFMVRTRKYDGSQYHGHWWHWLIGVPDTFTKIMIILYDDLTQNQRNLYLRIVNNYASNSRILKQLNNINVGAYSSSLAEIVLALGVLGAEEDTVRLSTETVIEVLKPHRKGAKSFQPDGSFVHENIPHTGFYGRLLLKSVAQIMFITKDTVFELESDDIQYLFVTIDQAFIPLIYDGELIASVCGRAISRAQPSTKIGYGSSLLYDLLIMSKSAPQPTQRNLQEALKFWMQKNMRYYLTNTRNYNDIAILAEILYDDSIIGDELPFYGVKLYASMDRFVHRTPDYMIGLALYSSRISAFDAKDSENKRGWHTADGMIYLYNDDDVQFNSVYWPTVDPYRLPGTTVDTIHLCDEHLNSGTFSEETWVGGVAYNNQAVIGMALNKINSKNCGKALTMDLRAKKSWFIVDGQIIALGAGITGSTTSSIETIVDNRLLNDKLRYLIFTDEGIVYDPAVATVATFVEMRHRDLYAHWILLQESTHKASIGYYFPKKEQVEAISERRSGTYYNINEQFASADTFSGNYSKLIIHHGRNPVNESYAYVMLPGITKGELKAYADSNPITILINTADIQAVKIREHNYIGINIWNEFGGEIHGISSNKPVSILKQTRNNEDTYIISDPTQSNGTVQVRIPEFTKIVRISEGVDYDGEYNVFVINFENKCGASEQFTVMYIVYE